MLRNYETVFITKCDIGDEAIKTLVEKFKNLLETSATLTHFDEWGKKRLAYLIDDHSEGYYVNATFQSEPDFPKELERIYKITDGILKDIVMRIDD